MNAKNLYSRCRRSLPPVLVGLAVACSFIPAARAAEVEEHFTRELPLSDGGTLVLKNQNGSITVQTWDSPKVVLDCRKVVTADREEDARDCLRKVRVTITRRSPERIEVNTERPDEDGWGFLSLLFGERPVSRVEYRIRAPRQAHLHLASVNGSLEIVGPAGELVCDTVNGSISVEMAECPVQAETVNGQVDLTYDPQFDGRPAGRWLARLSSINGPVTIRLPEGIGADVSASTLNGSISSDFQLPVEREMVGSTADAPLGGGGPEIVLETLNGSIRILATR